MSEFNLEKHHNTETKISTLSNLLTSPEYQSETIVTDALFEYITEADLSAIKAAQMPDEVRSIYETYKSQEKEETAFKSTLIKLAAYYGEKDFCQRAGISKACPPSSVHALHRTPLEIGDLYHCDMICETLKLASLPFPCRGSFLDFGCSSGRVVRNMRAVFSSANWYGCDPQPTAIAWANKSLTGINFRVSPITPPTEYESDFFDGVFAISIWSHFSERSGLAWLKEMRRIIKPGGWLMFTALGLNSLWYYARTKRRSSEGCLKDAETLRKTGFLFHPQYSSKQNWEVTDTIDWGMAYMMPEWVITKVLKIGFMLTCYRCGRAGSNQDIFLLIAK